MRADRSEATNLAAANPQIVAKLSSQSGNWAARSFVSLWDKKTPGGVFKGTIDGSKPRGETKTATARQVDSE